MPTTRRSVRPPRCCPTGSSRSISGPPKAAAGSTLGCACARRRAARPPSPALMARRCRRAACWSTAGTVTGSTACRPARCASNGPRERAWRVGPTSCACPPRCAFPTTARHRKPPSPTIPSSAMARRGCSRWPAPRGAIAPLPSSRCWRCAICASPRARVSARRARSPTTGSPGSAGRGRSCSSASPRGGCSSTSPSWCGCARCGSSRTSRSTSCSGGSRFRAAASVRWSARSARAKW